MKKFSGLLRYSQGTATDGFSLTGMAYTNTWNSTDQNPAAGLSRPGRSAFMAQLDPTDGGDTSRFSLSARMAQTTDDGSWKANAYLVKYTMDLWNNYTWDTNDPVNGDQFHQHDDRVYGGGGASRTFDGTFAGLPTETVLGVQTRDDDIDTALNNSFQRQFLSRPHLTMSTRATPPSMPRTRCIGPTGCGPPLGWRGDYYAASVNSMLQPANSGNPNEAIGSPKLPPWCRAVRQDRIFCRRRHGLSQQRRARDDGDRGARRSDDAGGSRRRFWCARAAPRSAFAPRPCRISTARSAFSTSTRIRNCSSTATPARPRPGCPASAPASRSPTIIAGLLGAYRRQSGALARPVSRLRYDQDELYQSLAGYPQAQIGNAPGNYVYNAPWMVASAGITLGEKTGWFSALRWRYISSRPLTEDGVFQSPPMNVINGGVGYRFDNGWRIQLDALNLLNSTTDQATYAYGSLLTTDALFAMCYPRTGTDHAGGGLPERRDGLCLSSDRAAGVSADARRAAGNDRSRQHSGDGRGACSARSPPTRRGAGRLRLDRALYRRACRQRWSSDQRQHRQHRDRRRVGARSTANRRIGTAAFRSATTT